MKTLEIGWKENHGTENMALKNLKGIQYKLTDNY
jgi:hypothetical protein